MHNVFVAHVTTVSVVLFPWKKSNKGSSFWIILYISLKKKRKVDMGEVLTYPLTLVPLSLIHVDGTMLKKDICHRLREEV